MADEARAMLDALMGGDRNAPLPKGASLKRGSNEGGGPVLVSTKKQKSCYDHDVDPLYCAWGGVDVYDLFVNTKSDIGPNPKIPSDSAKEEYAQLPKHEQERLGFEHMLFTKLQDLTRMCDRTVSRNKEKLRQEQQRQQQQQQGGSMDYVTDVDEVQVERLCRAQLDMDNVLTELEEKEKQLQEIIQQELVLQQAKEAAVEDKQGENSKEEPSKEDETEETAEAPKAEDEKEPTEEKEPEEKADTDTNEANKEESSKNKDEADTKNKTETPNEEPLGKEEMELLLKRQKLLFDMARILQQYAPIQNAVESQKEHLHVVKSDISSDKTVCEISGNFMSARDADERIAAHYAGKQYVGWKLVRDKLKEMVQRYGRYGPPRGGGRGDYGGSRGEYRGGGDRYRRGPSPPQQQRWDRGGRDRGGGYDGRGGSYSRYGGGGGGGDWRRGGRDRGGHWRR